MHAFPSSGPALGFLDLVGGALPSRPAQPAQHHRAARRRVLAVVDATPEGQQAAWRGALVARDCGLPLHLVDAGRAPQAQSHVQRLARLLQQRLGVASSAQAAGADLERVLPQLSPGTGLLVLPYRRASLLAESLFGTMAQRIARAMRVPTIVVQRAATASYRRVLVPVELDDHAASAIEAARRISRDPCIRVLHVLDRWPEQSLRLVDVAEAALRANRQRRSRDAYLRLNHAIAQAGAHERAAAVVSFGDAWSRVPEVARASRAQLVVLGQRRFSLLEQLFKVSVSAQLIGTGSADVLLLPLQDRAGAPDGPQPPPH